MIKWVVLLGSMQLLYWGGVLIEAETVVALVMVFVGSITIGHLAWSKK